MNSTGKATEATGLPSVNEFDLIDWIRTRVGSGHEGLVIGIGDDAAVLESLPGQQYVVSHDVLVAGVHFDGSAGPGDVGYKSLAVNLSDLAAMGAVPGWALLGLTMPAVDRDWLEPFIEGFLSLAEQHRVVLVGGDTSRGALSVGVTVIGHCDPGAALRRDGARPGDLVVVSGIPGMAALARRQIESAVEVDAPSALRLHRPRPRVALGMTLVGKATSCIDVSDGLWADLQHVAKASGCGADIETHRLPRSAALDELEDPLRLSLQLAGGDDYELCFTWPANRAAELPVVSSATGTMLTVIGRVSESPGVRCFDEHGELRSEEYSGYRHFE